MSMSGIRPGRRRLYEVEESSETTVSVLPTVREALHHQAKTLMDLSARIDARFDHAVQLLAAVDGHVIVAGIGKSGIVARKISSTLASLGTPSFFLHAGEALHGDLGCVRPRDAVVFVSHSGMTDEVMRMLPRLHELDVPTLAIVGDANSPLARAVDVALGVGMPSETCPLDLAPTTSSLAAMALGDALAVALAELRGITRDHFHAVHPGGNIGRRLAGRPGPGSIADD